MVFRPVSIPLALIGAKGHLASPAKTEGSHAWLRNLFTTRGDKRQVVRDPFSLQYLC